MTDCRSCGGDIELFYSLGDQYLSDFREDDSKPPQYPLDICFCPNCFLVQVDETVPRELLYHDRYGFKSGVNGSIVADLSNVVSSTLKMKSDPGKWLDIASNDGTLLSLVPSRTQGFGIDPVKKLSAEARKRNPEAHIISDFFDPTYFYPRSFDVVTSISVFYDLDDPNEFVAGVKRILSDEGVWVVQQNYLLPTVQLGALDNFCHEHVTYFSLMSMMNLLDRHDLRVFHVETSTVNGGSFRTYICKKGKRVATVDVSRMLQEEKHAGLDRIEEMKIFGLRSDRNLDDLQDVVRKVAETNEIYYYGASTRGAVLWQAAGINGEVTCAVERNPDKVGKWFSPMGVPIISEAEARVMSPDYMLVGPWFFRDEFIDREAEFLGKGGKFIFPLPRVEVFP